MSDYPWIRKWYRMMGLSPSDIDDHLTLADQDKAPRHALYRNANGTWATTNDITNPTTRWELGLPPLPEVSIHLRAAELLLTTLRKLNSLHGDHRAGAVYSWDNTGLVNSGEESTVHAGALRPRTSQHSAGADRRLRRTQRPRRGVVLRLPEQRRHRDVQPRPAPRPLDPVTIAQFRDGHPHRYPHRECHRRAVVFVTYFSDGSSRTYSCAQHLTQIIRTVTPNEPVPERAAVTVRPVTQ